MSALDDVLRLIATHLALHDSWPREVRLDAPRLRALAHELDGEDFRRLCEHLQLRARRTPGASAGGRSVVQLHDTEHVPAATLERTRLWLGVRAADAPISSFADAFVPRLEQWGLRGDPHLWDALRRRFVGRLVPIDDVETAAVLHFAIGELIGHDLRASPEHIEVPAFSIGSGMSDGHVDRDFWTQTAIPLLVDRARALRRRT